MNVSTNIHAAARPHKSPDIFAWFRQVHADPSTTAPEFRLVYVISQFVNKKTGVCFPLQSTLAKELGVTDRALRTYIAGLVDRGHLIVRHRGRDKSAVYQPLVDDRKRASSHDTERPEDTFQSYDEEDRKSGVARPEVLGRKTGTVLPTEPPSELSSITKERRAPKAPRRKAPSVSKDSYSEGTAIEGEIISSGVAVAPPPDHLQRAIARARRIQNQQRVAQ